MSWVEEGLEPPKSKVPRLDDGTASTIPDVLEVFTGALGLKIPDHSQMWRLREMDMGSREDIGIAAYPIKEGREYPRFVSSVDKDGNEVAGIRMPDISVPVGTHTGWNPRDPSTGAPDQIISMVGFTNYFPASGKSFRPHEDLRDSINDRYLSKENYLEMVSKAAEKLVKERYLIKEDIGVVLQKCAQRYGEAISRGNQV